MDLCYYILNCRSDATAMQISFTLGFFFILVHCKMPDSQTVNRKNLQTILLNCSSILSSHECGVSYGFKRQVPNTNMADKQSHVLLFLEIHC